MLIRVKKHNCFVVDMNDWSKLFLQGLKWMFSVAGNVFALYVFLKMLLDGYAFFWEPVIAILLFEMAFFAFGIIIQFIPIKQQAK